MLEIGTSKSLLNKTKGKYINYSLGKAWADIDANTFLFAWWRKDCQSFQICLFASFTSCRYGCVLRAMSSCVPSSLFSFLDDFEALAHCLAPHSRFGSAIGHGWVPGKSGGGQSSRIQLKGSQVASTIPLTLHGPPATPCCLLYSSGLHNHLDYCMTSPLVSTTSSNLLYF